MSADSEMLKESYPDKPLKAETWSGIPLKEIYTPEDVKGLDYQRDLGNSGEYPFTRGIYHNMYRGKYPTRRIICGFGSAADTNNRLKYYIDAGFTGLDVYPDLASQFNIDPDHPKVRDEIGVQGVNIASLKDFERLVEGIPLDKVTVNWRGLAIPYLAIVAEQQGLDLAALRGTIMNMVPLAAHWIVPSPEGLSVYNQSLKLAVDTTEFCTRYMTNFNATYVDGYNLREFGLTAPQELAWIFSQAVHYVDSILKRGLKIDEFGPRITFFMSAHKDFFEEIAKFRAARRMWARIMKDRYGAKDPKSMKFRFAVETAGSSLTAQQPLNNVVRITYEVIAAMLGGSQSMSPPSYLEAVSLPTEESARLQVRTQQILTFETGIPNVADPLGGAYYIEYLTDELEKRADQIIQEITDRGGILEAVKTGWIDRMVDEATVLRQREIESKERIVVGLNSFIVNEEKSTGDYFRNPVHEHEAGGGRQVIAGFHELKAARDNEKVREAMRKLYRTVRERGDENLIPAIIEAAKTYATQMEMIGTIRQAYGFKYDPFGVVESPFQDLA